jgi:hypothetical protein
MAALLRRISQPDEQHRSADVLTFEQPAWSASSFRFFLNGAVRFQKFLGGEFLSCAGLLESKHIGPCWLIPKSFTLLFNSLRLLYPLGKYSVLSPGAVQFGGSSGGQSTDSAGR